MGQELASCPSRHLPPTTRASELDQPSHESAPPPHRTPPGATPRPIRAQRPSWREQNTFPYEEHRPHRVEAACDAAVPFFGSLVRLRCIAAEAASLVVGRLSEGGRLPHTQGRWPPRAASKAVIPLLLRLGARGLLQGDVEPGFVCFTPDGPESSGSRAAYGRRAMLPSGLLTNPVRSVYNGPCFLNSQGANTPY